MEHPDQTLTLATCTLYNLSLASLPDSLTVLIKNTNGDPLLQKPCPARKRNKELRVSLALRVTFTPDEHEIIVVLLVNCPQGGQGMQQIGEFSIDLEQLSQNRTQFFKISSQSMVKISVQPPSPKRKLPELNYSNSRNIEQFIKNRENFLQSLKERQESLHRCSSAELSIPHTPEFTKESFFCHAGEGERHEELRDSRYGEELTDKIKRLLAKTRQIRQEQLEISHNVREQEYEEEELEYRQSRLTEMPSGTSLSRVRSHNQLSRESNFPRQPPVQSPANQSIEYHEHYHIYRPTGPPESQRSRLRKGYHDLQTNHCRTNDSESVSNYQEDHGYMNAKNPFKFGCQQ